MVRAPGGGLGRIIDQPGRLRRSRSGPRGVCPQGPGAVRTPRRSAGSPAPGPGPAIAGGVGERLELPRRQEPGRPPPREGGPAWQGWREEFRIDNGTKHLSEHYMHPAARRRGEGPESWATQAETSAGAIESSRRSPRAGRTWRSRARGLAKEGEPVLGAGPPPLLDRLGQSQRPEEDLPPANDTSFGPLQALLTRPKCAGTLRKREVYE